MTKPNRTPAPRRSRKLAHVRCLLASGVLSAGAANAQSAEQEASIRQHRMGTLVIDAAPGAAVRVEQVRHEFRFGAALANQVFEGGISQANAARYKAVFLETFNAAVTENALKWAAMERRKGRVNYETVDAILEWTDRHDIPLRGHNIFWGVPKFVQPWLMELDADALRATLRTRARDIGARYRGRFAEYDLNNEMIHGDYYADRLGPGITLEMAQWVKEEDPEARLFLNDYDILTGRRLVDYVAHIRELLEMGVPIAGIGVQGHLHGDSFDPAAVHNALDQLAQFNLPVCVTEFNFPGQHSKFHGHRELAITPEEEATKAAAIVDYYRICFAHPIVDGILMWGFWEGANWIPQSSLYKLDWTPTPAAHAYRDLIFNEWWTRWSGTADENGRCEVHVFFGKHRVTSGEKTVVVYLGKADGSVTATLR